MAKVELVPHFPSKAREGCPLPSGSNAEQSPEPNEAGHHQGSRGGGGSDGSRYCASPRLHDESESSWLGRGSLMLERSPGVEGRVGQPPDCELSKACGLCHHGPGLEPGCKQSSDIRSGTRCWQHTPGGMDLGPGKKQAPLPRSPHPRAGVSNSFSPGATSASRLPSKGRNDFRTV